MAEEEAVAFCTSCRNTIPDHHAKRDAFLAAGQMGVCTFCKGPTIVIMPSDIERYRDRPPGQIF